MGVEQVRFESVLIAVKDMSVSRRFYDPDGHIIEVGEDMRAVVERFKNSGMTDEQVAERMDVPLEYVLRIGGEDGV